MPGPVPRAFCPHFIFTVTWERRSSISVFHTRKLRLSLSDLPEVTQVQPSFQPGFVSSPGFLKVWSPERQPQHPLGTWHLVRNASPRALP